VAAPASQLPPADALLLRAAVTTCFDAQRLGALALVSFSERLDAGYAEAVLDWLARPETRELLARATWEPAEPATRVAAVEPDTSGRDALLAHFDRRSGHAARAGREAALVFAAMLRAANPLLPPVQRYSADELDLLSSWLRSRFGSITADASLLRRRYAGISSQEIESTLAFLESPPGVWLQRQLDGALERALVRAARATAARLIGALGRGGRELPLQVARLPEP